MKTCPKCGRDLPLSDFCANRANRDGLQSRCRTCHSEEKRAYYLKNRQRIFAQRKVYLASPEGRKAHGRRAKAHRSRNPDKAKARRAVDSAVHSGRLIKKPCEFPGCGDPKVQAHHDDYSRPLDVVWYCAFHHRVVEGKVAA